MDGNLVYGPFHLVGFYSVFSEDLVANADFCARGFGAEYTGTVDPLNRSERRVGQVPVHNYRVPPLELGEDYRIAVEGRRGNVTSAVVRVPARQPAITALDTLRYRDLPAPGADRKALPVQVRVDSVRRLARVAATYACTFCRDRPESDTVTGPHTVATIDERINESSFRVLDPHKFRFREPGCGRPSV